MKILALESSAKAASVCLWEDGVLLAESYQNSGLTHSRTLLPMCQTMLDNCGHQLSQADVIAVASGPGSFTGLRIGLSTAKGLAWPRQLPCIGVSRWRPWPGIWHTWTGSSAALWTLGGSKYTTPSLRPRTDS